MKHPNLADFRGDQNQFLLVKRVAIERAGLDVVVVAHLFGGGRQGFLQAFSLDSWVIAGCHDKDVISKDQLRALLELGPRFEPTDEHWNYLVEKAKTGRMREEEKRTADLGVKNA